MKYDYNDLLKDVLKPSDEPDKELLTDVKQVYLNPTFIKPMRMKHHVAAAIITCFLLIAGSTTIVNAASGGKLFNKVQSFFSSHVYDDLSES